MNQFKWVGGVRRYLIDNLAGAPSLGDNVRDHGRDGLVR